MPWVYSQDGGTPPSYSSYNASSYNQVAAPVVIPSNCAVTQLKAYGAGKDSSINARLALWEAGGALKVQTETFSMAQGTESNGGQFWYTQSIEDTVLNAGTYWVGIYRNPSQGHISGTTTTGTNGYSKINSNGYPSILSMNSYDTENKQLYVGLFYIISPADPTSASVSRVSDTQHTIEWTNNSSSDQPYDNVYIERYDNDTDDWYQKAIVSGETENYTDNTTVGNRKYRYRIRAKNSAGYSDYATTDYINTTPAQPTNVTAKRQTTTVLISWTNPASNETGMTIQRKTSSDGVSWGSYSTLDSGLSADETSYVDSSPANYNYYQVRADTTDPTLHSDYVESNLVPILAPPNTATNLSPTNFEGQDIDGTARIEWQHNSSDTSEQTYVSARFREPGEAWTRSVSKVAKTQEYMNLILSGFTVGQWEFEIRTWGAATSGGESGDGSSYYEGSGYEIGSFYVGNLPECVITQPGLTYTLSFLQLQWTYTSDDSADQINYTAKLYDSNDVLLESRTFSTDTLYSNFDYDLENGEEYTITLQVQDENYLWSEEQSVTFTVDYNPPATPTFTITANEDEGSIVVDITNPTPEGDEVETSYNQLYRSIDGGETYELSIDNIPTNTSITDYLPLVGGTTYYYVVAVSSDPNIAISEIDSIEMIITGKYFINAGNEYENYIGLYGDISLSEKLGNETELRKFEGRTYPVKFENTQLEQVINISCDLTYTNYNDLKEILELTGDKFYRDFRGRYFYCNIEGASLTRKDNSAYQINLIISRIESED